MIKQTCRLPDVGYYTCFPGTESVQLENNSSKPIQEVSVGDRILSMSSNGKLLFSPVVYVMHPRNNQKPAEFITIHTLAGVTVTSTIAHLFMLAPCGKISNSLTHFDLVKASSLSIGDCIKTINGDGYVEVTQLERWFGQDVYSVITLEEYIVINSRFIVSPFAHYHSLLKWSVTLKTT